MSIKYYDKSGATPEEKLLAGVSPVDAILNGTSKNAIQNKAVYNALKDKLEAATTDLIYYYLKTDVYNKSEVRALIGAVETLTMEVVSSLPVSDISTTTIYLLKPTGSNVYDEYVYINDAWVKIGTTDMDLSGYMLTADFNVAIADYFTKAEINNLLNSYYTKAEIDADFYDKDAVDDLIADVSTDIDDTAADIYEVMGKNGAKNLLPNNTTSKTINGITYTVNDDGSVTANGTATANAEFIFIKDTDDVTGFKNLIRDKTVTLSGCPSGGSGTTYTLRKWGQSTSGTYYDTGNGVTFTADAESLDNNSWNFQIRVYNGVTVSNLTFYPMLRLASDTDSTYQPYAETNYQLTQDKMSYADNGILGAKNLLPNNKTTATVSGVTYTSQSDGSFIVTGATTTSPSYSDVMSSFTLPAGTYIFSSPNTGITSDIELVLDDITSGTSVRVSTLYNSTAVTFTLGSTRTLHCYMWVNSNITLPSGGVHFYPMIRLASDPDSTYQPYAMTNRELTHTISDIGTILTSTTVTTSVTSGGYVEVCRITLPKGVWVLRGYAQYPNNPTGIRAFGLSIAIDTGTSSPINAKSGWAMCLPDTMIRKITSDTVVHGVCYQTSGQTLTLLQTSITAVRIK